MKSEANRAGEGYSPRLSSTPNGRAQPQPHNQTTGRKKLFGFFRYGRFDWVADVENLKFLIRWFYKADAELWQDIADNEFVALALNASDLTVIVPPGQ